MTSASVESPPRSGRRWWGLVTLIFVVQLALIFWLGDTSRSSPGRTVPAFTFKLAGSASAELLALNDPTLFALPHRQGSVGPASSVTPRPDAHSFQWPEPTNSLRLAVDQLGTAFSHYIETNEFNSLQLPASVRPKLTLPSLPPPAVSAERSTLFLEGDLAPRRLIAPLPLRSWTNLDILANSVIRIAVDADGRPVAPTLLSRSGSSEADQYALEQARAARFEPLRRNPADTAPHLAADFRWGTMVFRWHTVPQPPTKAPGANP
jgi:hypothetical protein